MTSTERHERVEDANRILDSVRAAENSALQAARKFVDTVDGAFPDLSEDGPRRKIIDSAFKMTEELVGASTNLAENIMKAVGDGLGQPKTGTST